MELKEIFNEIGFTDYVHLDKKKRDGIERKALSRKILDGWLTIVLRKSQGDTYEIEKISVEGSLLAKKFLNYNDIKQFLIHIKMIGQ